MLNVRIAALCKCMFIPCSHVLTQTSSCFILSFVTSLIYAVLKQFPIFDLKYIFACSISADVMEFLRSFLNSKVHSI